jgi:hypothetical protein
LPAGQLQFVIDDVIGQRRTELLAPFVAIIAIAILVDDTRSGTLLSRIMADPRCGTCSGRAARSS